MRKYDTHHEIDIFIPSISTGFEYDGLYWHCTDLKKQNYHVDKHAFFIDKGVNVYHIYEDEWQNKQEIVKSYIRSKLGMYETTIPFYLCQVKQININDSLSFLEGNSLQFEKQCDISYGCYIGKNLVSVINFSLLTNGYRKITGFGEKNGVHLLDAKKMLINHFINKYNPNKLLIDVFLRLDNENEYKELGFVRCGEKKVSKYYVKRVRYEEKDILEKYKIYKEETVTNETLEEFCEQNNFKELYDCGVITMCYTNESEL